MAADRTSGGFGGKLRDARERRGISLRQIANATKISVGALEALERNDISRLPGGIFSRAFVRSYAIEVGLDPDATIQEFIAQFPHDSVTAGHPTTERVEDHVSVESDRRMAGTFLWLLGFEPADCRGGAVLRARRARGVEHQAPPPVADDAARRGCARRGAAGGVRRRAGGACCRAAAGAGRGRPVRRRPPRRPRRRAGRGRRSPDRRAVGQAAVLGVGDGRRRSRRSSGCCSRASGRRSRCGARWSSRPATRRPSR